MITFSIKDHVREMNTQNFDLQQSIYIAANLYNSEKILPTFTKNLIQISKLFLSANKYNRVFISIFENGSTDHTKTLLLNFKKELEKLNIPHNIRISEDPKAFFRRIPYLAKVRNEVLNDLGSFRYDKVLFLNDIIFKIEDVLKLLSLKDTDAVCGLDFTYRFYDIMVTRDNVTFPYPVSGVPPYFFDPVKWKLFKKNKLIPVFSCWNGLVVFKSDIFEKIKFRSLHPLKTNLGYEASECCLIFSDMHKFNRTRIFIDPTVKITYNTPTWLESIVFYFDKYFLYYFNYPKIPKEGSKEFNNFELMKKLAIVDGLENEFDLACVQ
ncbi:hypothetical protein HK099_001409 [Clydaea vesicula]|uniref:Glycosyltransferase family 69 protein n=1 Tax=Clydaea vesicula TaxID=447962 RepID=A0AAD5TWD3_9FUNG|nr:hypothetical protein HK099_001409 [Clydaea vesicula]